MVEALPSLNVSMPWSASGRCMDFPLLSHFVKTVCTDISTDPIFHLLSWVNEVTRWGSSWQHQLPPRMGHRINDFTLTDSQVDQQGKVESYE